MHNSYKRRLEDVLEKLGWISNEKLHNRILKASKEKGRISAEQLRKEI